MAAWFAGGRQARQDFFLNFDHGQAVCPDGAGELSQVRGGALQIKQPLNYLFLKGQAVTLLVFGQRRAALARFDAMLLLAPASRYVLASRAHLLGETGGKTRCHRGP